MSSNGLFSCGGVLYVALFMHGAHRASKFSDDLNISAEFSRRNQFSKYMEVATGAI